MAPIDPVMDYVGYESGKIISSLEILVSGNRLVAIAAFKGTFYFGRHNVLIVWDWRRGQRVLVSLYPHLKTLLTPRRLRKLRVVGLIKSNSLIIIA